MKATKIACFVLLLWAVTAQAAPLNVVCTLPVLGDFAKVIGGPFVNVQTLAQPNQDPHSVIPTPTLIKKARNADVFIENGLSLELWAQNVVDSSSNAKIQTGQPGHIVASRGVATIENPSQLSRALGDVHPGGNPHIWLDPENTKIMAKNIAQGLSAVDPAHAKDYAQNLEQFQKTVDEKMQSFAKLAAPLKGQSFVSYHKSFGYLAKRFGFSIPMEIEDKPGITPSAKHRDAVVDAIKQDKIPALILEVYYDRKAAEYISDKTGAKIVQTPIDVGSTPDTMHYFDLIQSILSKLVAAVKG